MYICELIKHHQGSRQEKRTRLSAMKLSLSLIGCRCQQECVEYIEADFFFFRPSSVEVFMKESSADICKAWIDPNWDYVAEMIGRARYHQHSYGMRNHGSRWVHQVRWCILRREGHGAITLEESNVIWTLLPSKILKDLPERKAWTSVGRILRYKVQWDWKGGLGD